MKERIKKFCKTNKAAAVAVGAGVASLAVVSAMYEIRMRGLAIKGGYPLRNDEGIVTDFVVLKKNGSGHTFSDPDYH